MPARRLLIAVCALALTACTPLIDDPSSPSTAAPAASETSGNESTTADAQAPTFELGEFDPEGDFELFDPCTEIPAEVLTEAGFGEQISEPYYDRNISVRCGYDAVEHPNGLLAITGDRNAKSKIVERGLMIADQVESSVPGAYLHELTVGDAGHCHAAVSTTRGRFVVNYGEISPSRTQSEICEIALEKLETIHNHFGGNDETGN